MYYTPGMISLAFLLLLFVWILLEYQKLQKQNVLEVSMFPNPNAERTAYPAGFVFEIPKRNYRTITFRGTLNEDKTNLTSFQLQLRELLAEKDTVNGLHLLFEDKAKYESYVQALNICRIENAQIYIPQKNHLWLSYLKPSPTVVSPTICGNLFLPTDTEIATSAWNGQDKETRLKLWLDLTRDFALPLIAFGVLLLLSTIDVIKQIRTVANTAQSRQLSRSGAWL